MLSWLTQLFNRIRYGKLITEDYTGKVVQVGWNTRASSRSGYWMQYGISFITVLQDDGKYNVAGPVFIESAFQYTPINPKTGLLHARKGSVTVVADSVAEYVEAKRIKETRKKYQQSVCSNEAGKAGVVTDYDGTTFCGRTLEGAPWESKDPKRLATSYKRYIERKATQ